MHALRCGLYFEAPEFGFFFRFILYIQLNDFSLNLVQTKLYCGVVKFFFLGRCRAAIEMIKSSLFGCGELNSGFLLFISNQNAQFASPFLSRSRVFEHILSFIRVFFLSILHQI